MPEERGRPLVGLDVLSAVNDGDSLHRVCAVERRDSDRALCLHRVEGILPDKGRHVLEHVVNLRHELPHPRCWVHELARAREELVVKELSRALEHAASGGETDVESGGCKGKRLRAVENRKEPQELFCNGLLPG